MPFIQTAPKPAGSIFFGLDEEFSDTIELFEHRFETQLDNLVALASK